MVKMFQMKRVFFLSFSAAWMMIIPQSDAVDTLSQEKPEILHVQIAQGMDSAYYAAGTRVDIAGFDLEELARQGKAVPGDVKEKVRTVDQALRQQWLVLEHERQTIENDLRLLSESKAAHQLRVENLTEGTAGESGWFALRWAMIVYPDGKSVKIGSSEFKGGAFNANYSYQCEPSPCAVVYGQGSRTHTMAAWFDLPVPATAATRLVISGLDQDKPGQTSIRILLNGVILFEGKNEYQKSGWSDQSYPIPEETWKHSVPALSSKAIYERLEKWKGNVNAFTERSRKQADEIDQLTRPLRTNLLWKKRDWPRDWWESGFLRGMCYECDVTSPPDPYGRPWFADNLEYVSKAFASIGVNMIYMYPSEPIVFPLLAAENEKIGTPVVECHWETAHPSKRKDKGVSFYLDAESAAREVEGYIRNLGGGGTTLRGISVDEPRIDEMEATFSTQPEILALWRKHLASQDNGWRQKGLTNPANTPPVLKVKSDPDRVVWMEWQYFKIEFVTDFYARLFDLLHQKGLFTFFVVQDYLQHEPQVAAYPYYGAKLPMISTDLYNNAGLVEAYNMDLLRSVSKGKAVLLPGSGYSAHTPDRFHRTLANAMLRADGVVQWIYTYASKYRARYFFVRPGIKDDRGRDALDNWRPEYWDIQSAVYRGMEKAEYYLTDTQPTAQVAVLYSMRSVIAESATNSFWGNTGNRNGFLVYNALVNLHRPVEGCMVEGLTPEKLKRYKVMFLIDAPALSPQECERLRNWVRGGGTLIVGANTSLQDQWGRAQSDYELADMFGLHFKRMEQGVSAFAFQGDNEKYVQVVYDKSYGYADVVVDKAKVLSRWENNTPALLVNSVGLGGVYYISAQRPGFYNSSDNPLSGIYEESKPGFPKLFRHLAALHQGPPVVEVIGAPEDLEVQVRQKGKAIIVHLLDWREDRTVNGLEIKLNKPGSWKARYPMTGEEGGNTDSHAAVKIKPVRVHSMIILEEN